mmetsp:Transcript_94007/g.186390  ORF Transcript_94007/g.186390 Transcript_94007/m.186390 type:complete len:595 (-) Transcript_94007:185-1969(-)
MAAVFWPPMPTSPLAMPRTEPPCNIAWPASGLLFSTMSPQNMVMVTGPPGSMVTATCPSTPIAPHRSPSATLRSPSSSSSGIHMPQKVLISVNSAPAILNVSPLPSCRATASEDANIVMVGSRTFERMHKLGRGSFATVWQVREKSTVGNKTVEEAPIWALKVSSPENEQMLEACLLEAEILQQLAFLLPDEIMAANRVPRYVAHTVSGARPAGCPRPAASPRHGQVLVAMSKLEGKPLDQWLYGVDENRMKTITMSELFDGPLPGGQFATKNFAGACTTAAALLSQMTPVFTALSRIAYHRDVSAHNFLIREDAGVEEFSLLDFGLAVRASTWEAECRNKSICGDPRYFTPAAWTLMALGKKATQAMPDSTVMLRQYEKRIDHFSFGILVLEVLFALWRGPEWEDAMLGQEKEALATAQKAWRDFWAEAVGLFQKFHGDGPSATRRALIQANVLSQYKDKLTALCSALRLAHDAVQSGLPALVFKIVAELADPQGTMCWQDIKASLDDTEAAFGQTKVRSNTEADAENVASAQQGSALVPATEDAAWNWSSALESTASWVAMRLTRNMLGLALVGTDKPKIKKGSRRRKTALC